MGHRANYVVVRHGRTTVTRDRWGALGLPSTLLDGPDAWERYSRDSDDPGDAPYDEAWAEGGVRIDLDRRELRFYSDINVVDASVGLRRAFLPLLAERWPGWEVAYAHRRLADLLAGTGFDTADLVGAEPVTPLAPDALHGMLGTVTYVLSTPLDIEQYAEEVSPFSTLRQLQGWAAVVLTVRHDDGRIVDHVGGMPLDRTLAIGPDLLDHLAHAPSSTSPPHERLVGAGACIDATTRTVEAWESGKSTPTPTAKKLMHLIDQDHSLVQKL